MIVEKTRKLLFAKAFYLPILMDLLKAFDCLNHELLIAELEAYGFSRSALTLIYNYLSNIIAQKNGNILSSYLGLV